MSEPKKDTTKSNKRKNDSEETPQDEEVVDVDFDLFNYQPSDFHYVKELIKTFLEDNAFSTSEFADLIITQVGIGSTIRVDDSEESYGFITTVNLTRHKQISGTLFIVLTAPKEKECVQQIKQYILSKIQDADTKKTFTELLNDDSKQVGLIVHERVINIPPQLGPPMLKLMFQEILTDIEDVGPECEWNLDYYILITSGYQQHPKPELPETNNNNSNQGFSTKETDTGKKQKTEPAPVEEEVFYKPEEEILVKECTALYKYNVTGKQETWTIDALITPFRIIGMFPASKIPGIIKKLDKFEVDK